MMKTVLLVEDEPNIVLSLEFLMGQAGFGVRVAGDGEKAMEELNAEAPNLVILDLMLPKMDGLSVCEAIRANDAWHDVAILVLSAKSREADRKRAMELGADDYITKPFSNKDLVERAQALIESRAGT